MMRDPRLRDRVIDLESGVYQYILTPEQKKMTAEQLKGTTREHNPEYPQNYFNAVRAAMKKYDFVLVAWNVIVQYCIPNRIKYWHVYPTPDQKDEYMERLRTRGNPQTFIDKISEQFQRCIDDINADKTADKKIELQKHEFLRDALAPYLNLQKLICVRHGKTDWYVEKRTQGWSQNPINAVGACQMAETCRQLAKNHLKIEHFYSSDLSRARMSAEILNLRLKMNVVYDKNLRERSSGTLEGVLKTPDNMLGLKTNPKQYNAESWEDLFVRTRAFLDGVIARRETNVLIVTHAHVLSMIKYIAQYDKKAWDGADPEFAKRITHFENGRIYVIYV